MSPGKAHRRQETVWRGATDLHELATVERSGDGVDGKFDGVAVAAEVAEDNMAQGGSAGADGKIGGGAGGEMAVGGHDTLLDGKRSFGVSLEHLLVVIGFDEKTIDAGDVVDNGVVDVSEIGEDADGDGVAADGEADRIGGVVRDGKSGDFEGVQAEGAARGEEAPFGGGIAFILPADFVRGKARGVNRTTESAKQDGQTADVVAMFVGQQDGADGGRVEARGVEALKGFFRAETGIDQDGGVIRKDDGRIAIAAAAQDDEFHTGEGSGRGGPGQIRFVFRLWPSGRPMR